LFYNDIRTIGNFSSSNVILNENYKNAYWGIRGNYRSIPTDCPQRDERMGWLGDRSMILMERVLFLTIIRFIQNG